jgi:hypothetical protein
MFDAIEDRAKQTTQNPTPIVVPPPPPHRGIAAALPKLPDERVDEMARLLASLAHVPMSACVEPLLHAGSFGGF